MAIKYACPDCGSFAVQETCWVWTNTREIADEEPPLETYFCKQCETHSTELDEVIVEEAPRRRRYVLNSNTEVHTTDMKWFLEYMFVHELRLPQRHIEEWPPAVVVTGLYDDNTCAPSEEIYVHVWVAANHPEWFPGEG
jgi:hypothetical protein